MRFVSQFFRDTGIYGTSAILTRGIGLLMLPFYARVFTAGELGVIEIIGVGSTFASVIVTLEISQAVARFLPDAEVEEKRVVYASTVFWFTFSGYVLFAAVFLGNSGLFSTLLLEDAAREPVFRMAVTAIAVTGFFRLMQNQLRYQLLSLPYAVNNLTYSALTAIITIFAYLVLKSGIRSIFIGQILGGLTGIVLAWWATREKYRFCFDTAILKELLQFSLPLVPSSLAVFIYQFVDRIAIKQILSLDELGIYGIGCRIASLIGLVLFGVNTALSPLIYHHYREAGSPREIARIFRYVMFLAFLLLLFLCAFSGPLILIFTTSKFLAAAPLIPILAATTLAFQLYIFAPGLAIAKKTIGITIISFTVATVNTILNILAIPIFGIIGAALASLVSGLLCFLLHVIFSQKHYPIDYALPRMVISSFILVATFGLAFGMHASSAGISGRGFFLDTVLFLGGATAITLILIPTDERVRFFRSLKGRKKTSG